MTGLGAIFFVDLNPSRVLRFIICREFGGRGGRVSGEAGISGSTYAMKLKLTPGNGP